MVEMVSQMSRAEAIQAAHANIEALLSPEATKNAFPEEVVVKAKHFFAQVYEAPIRLLGKAYRRPRNDLLIAAVIHAACRQCKGQSRTFNETAHLVGAKEVAVLEKYYHAIDDWLWSTNNSEVKEVENETAPPACPYIPGARTSAADLAARWSAMLDLDSKGIKLASELAGRIEESSSRWPAHTAGAAVYAVGRLLRMSLSIKEISDASKANIVSLKGAYREMYWRREIYCPMEWLLEHELDFERLVLI